MKWIEVDNSLFINLNWIEVVGLEDLEMSYSKPFLIVFATDKTEYTLSFKNDIDRKKYMKKLMQHIDIGIKIAND